MNTYKVGIYLRLSREDEKIGESNSITTQREILKNYIKENKLTLVEEYVDDGVSGTTFDRVGFNKMIHDCEINKINMIITKDTSRLGRDHIEFGYYVERYFPEHNIRYVAVNDGIDTANNTVANDMLVFKSAFNDLYVKDISNKLKSSIYIKKKNGCFIGPYAPYGYIKDPNNKHKLIINNQEAIIVKKIYQLFVSGLSINKICDYLSNSIPTPSESKNMKKISSTWSSRTVNDILKNQIYIGNMCQCKQKKVSYKSKKRINNSKENWIIIPDIVPPIIDKELFKKAELMFKSNKSRTSNIVTSSLLLKGLIYCKECHHTIGLRNVTGKTKKGIVNRIYGNCNYWIKKKKYHVCTPHSIKYDEIESLVLHNLKQHLKKIEIPESLFNIKKDQTEKEIKNIKNKLEQCYLDKLEGTISQELYNNISQKLNNKIKILEDNKPANIKPQEQIKKIINLTNPSRTLITSLINKIEIDEQGNIDIYYNFKIDTSSCYSTNPISK